MKPVVGAVCLPSAPNFSNFIQQSLMNHMDSRAISILHWLRLFPTGRRLAWRLERGADRRVTCTLRFGPADSVAEAP
eukprot:scaffold15786_cov37-Prasinocladus_malaysianus.AAC.1